VERKETVKRCNKCGEKKPLSAYSKNWRTGDGLQSICKACQAIAQKRWRENLSEEKKAEKKRVEKERQIANREKNRAKRAKWREKNSERARELNRQWCERNKEARAEKRRIAWEAKQAAKGVAVGKGWGRGRAVALTLEQEDELPCDYSDLIPMVAGGFVRWAVITTERRQALGEESPYNGLSIDRNRGMEE